MGIDLHHAVVDIFTTIETLCRRASLEVHVVEIRRDRPFNDVVLVALARTTWLLDRHDSWRIRTHDPEIDFDFRGVRVVPTERSQFRLAGSDPQNGVQVQVVHLQGVVSLAGVQRPFVWIMDMSFLQQLRTFEKADGRGLVLH